MIHQLFTRFFKNYFGLRKHHTFLKNKGFNFEHCLLVQIVFIYFRNICQ